jgi:hypothetical protein
MNPNHWNQASQQAGMAHMRRGQQQFQQQQQRWKMDNQQQQLRHLQQQVAARRARRQSAQGSPVASPSRPYVPGQLRRRLLMAVIVVVGLAVGVAMLAANQPGSSIGGGFGGGITVPMPGLGATPGGGPGTVTATPTVVLNVRSGPSVGAEVLGTVQPGEELRLACKDGGWDRLRSPHGGAYVSDRYVQRSGPLQPCD